MRLKLICCEVLYREVCHVIAASPNVVDVEFLPKGLHDIGSAGMRERLQAALDRVGCPPEGGRTACYDAVLFGYGLCNNGLAGLRAPEIPVVVPRAHDCITLFLGSKERYLEYFNSHPGVYFKTTGWIERSVNSEELNQLSLARRSGLEYQYEELVAKYGEENARYLYDTLSNHTRGYSQFTFIEMGVEPDDSFERRTRRDAAERGWTFEKVRGDLSLIQRLIDGPWEKHEFLVVPPGHSIAATYDESVVAAEEALP
jgi:Protein of unknown function (DUF1638)